MTETNTDAIAVVGSNLAPIGGDLDNLRRALDELVELGAGIAEIYVSRLMLVSAGRLITDRVAEARAILEARPLQYSIHAPIPINLMDRGRIDLHRRAAEVSLDLAGAFDAEAVVIHAGRTDPAAWARDAAGLLAFEREQILALGDRARSNGTLLAIENISPNQGVIRGGETSYSLDPAALALQLSRIEHDCVTGCLDFSHAMQGAGLMSGDFVSGVAAMAPYCAHFHISDCTGLPSIPGLDQKPDLMFFGCGDMHAPLGMGSIDFDALADAVSPARGARIVIELQAEARFALADTLKRTRDFAARINDRFAVAA